MRKPSHPLFAITAPGLEEVCAAELVALQLEGVRPVPGGVEFSGGLTEIYRANLWLRTASRVVVRLGEVRARDFPALFRKAVRLPWGRFIRPGAAVSVRAVSHASRLNHSGRIAETVAAAIAQALGAPAEVPATCGPLILARFDNDLCQLSVDSSGPLLHRRGYREETAAAPLRETLAAGILLLLGWDGATPLVDPFCGSGTFPIEAALLAARRAPGAQRDFAFMDWPRYRPGLWQALLAEAQRSMRNVPVTLSGSDCDPQHLASARRNAGRGAVADLIDFQRCTLAERTAPQGPGLLLCNPPYGERLGQSEDLLRLYRQLGQIYRQRFAGWQLAFLCPDPALARATGLKLTAAAELSNGGIRVQLLTTRGA